MLSSPTQSLSCTQLRRHSWSTHAYIQLSPSPEFLALRTQVSHRAALAQVPADLQKPSPQISSTAQSAFRSHGSPLSPLLSLSLQALNAAHTMTIVPAKPARNIAVRTKRTDALAFMVPPIDC